MDKISCKQFEFFYKITRDNIDFDNSSVIDDENLMRWGHFFGFDNISGSNGFFEIKSPYLRESVISTTSKCINRLRQLVVSTASINGAPLTSSLEFLLEKYYKNKRIFLLEDVSLFASIFKFFCRKHHIELVTSEFLGEGKDSGEIVNGVMHIDIQSTHFDSNYFDLILHTEVFEHVPDAPRGETEIVRLLKKNGKAVFTAPFEFNGAVDNVYARVDKNEIVYLKEPIYHDDPVAADGKCLVFRTFSFPGMKGRFNKLDCDFYSQYFHSSYLGIIGNNAITFIVNKK